MKAMAAVAVLCVTAARVAAAAEALAVHGTVIVPHADTPRGSVATHTVASARLHNERRISVYTSPGYRADDAPHPLLVLFDQVAAGHDALVRRGTLADGLITLMGPRIGD